MFGWIALKKHANTKPYKKSAKQMDKHKDEREKNAATSTKLLSKSVSLTSANGPIWPHAKHKHLRMNKKKTEILSEKKNTRTQNYIELLIRCVLVLFVQRVHSV